MTENSLKDQEAWSVLCPVLALISLWSSWMWEMILDVLCLQWKDEGLLTSYITVSLPFVVRQDPTAAPVSGKIPFELSGTKIQT